MDYRDLTDTHGKYMSFWMSLTATCPGLHGYMKVVMANMVTYEWLLTSPTLSLANMKPTFTMVYLKCNFSRVYTVC